MEMERLNVLVFGAGAVGTFIGGSLALSGERVVYLEQPKVVEELRRRGLHLDLRLDKRRKDKQALIVPPASFACESDLPAALGHGPFDVAVFALKSFDTAAALQGMQPFLAQMPPVLCLQNGVDNEPALADALGSGRVIAGTVTCSIGRRAAGDIVLEKARGVSVAAGHPLSARLVAALDGAGLNASLCSRAADMKWSKLLANLPGSATSAILDMTPAEVFDHPGLYDLEIRAARETLAVMAAQGIRPVDLPRTPVKVLAFVSRLPAFLARPLIRRVVGGGRGAKMPSFYIDLHAGRKKSEVDWLQGAVVRYGEKFGVPTPVNRVLVETLLGMVRGEIPLAEFSRQPEKLIALVHKEIGLEVKGTRQEAERKPS